MRPRCLLAWTIAGLAVVSPARAEPEDPAVPYRTRFEGPVSDELTTALRDASRLVAFRDTPPATRRGLVRRARNDHGHLRRVLESFGFYDGRVTTRVDTSDAPATVTVTVRPGVVYLMGPVTLDYTGKPPPGLPRHGGAIGLPLGHRARAEAVLAAEKRLRRKLAEAGYPLAQVGERRAVVHPDRKLLTLTLPVTTGPRARFGRARFEGLETVGKAYVRRLVAWRPGRRFDPDALRRTRRALLETNLFSGVTMEPADSLGPHGRLPVTIKVKEGPPRTIGGGVHYDTDKGPALHARWEHRNLWGHNETLSTRLTLSSPEQRLDVDLRKPLFLAYGQTLRLHGAALSETTEAFQRRALDAEAGVERVLSDVWTVDAAVAGHVARLEPLSGETETSRTSMIAALPLTLRADTTADRLDPGDGERLTARLAPAAGTFRDGVSYLEARLTGRVYRTLWSGGVAAARASVATLTGEPRDNIPQDRRLYAGGAGSVRGYAAQMVGPLDKNNDPLGGRGLAAVSLELRQRVSGPFGVVPFVEGAKVGADSTPGSGDTAMRWGAGLGLRYYTGIGPLRADVAVPIDRRRNVDDPFQVYVTLGQAF
mgnify:CR=1 FL=1